MPSLLLGAATRILTPLLLALSVVIFLRGHNEPGGGFIGGLVAATGLLLYGVAFGMTSAARLLRVRPQVLIGCGLLLATLSGVPGLFGGAPFLTGLWSSIAIPTIVAGTVKIGTVFFFDAGVFLVVFGIALLMAFSMAEEDPLETATPSD